MRRLVAVVAIGALALAAASCGSSKKSGASSKTVTLLTHNAFTVSKDVLDDFTRQTGYTIKLLQPGDAGLMVNQAILKKKHPEADAIFGVDNTFLGRALANNLFTPYTSKASDTLIAGVMTDPLHRVTPIDQGDVCLNYDKTYFDHDGHPPAPTQLTDLVDPRYKNLTVVENASTSSPGLVFLLATIATSGENGWTDYWKKLKANGVRVVNDWTEAYETDFTAGGGPGDRPIVVSYASSPPADVVGSNPHRDVPRVGVVNASCFKQYEFAGVLKGAKNAAGAKALIDFMLSPRFQQDMPLNMYVSPVVIDADLPEVFQKWAVVPEHSLTLDPTEIDKQRDTWIREWSDLVTH